MRAERLFLSVLDDIENRLTDETPTEYALLQVASLLRQLLLDGDRLLDPVAREAGWPVQFLVNRTSDTPRQVEGVLMDVEPKSLRPRALADASNHEWVKRDKFLSRHVLTLMSTTYTVRDIIDVASNSYGGRHLGRDKSPGKGQSLWDHADDSEINGVSLVAAYVADIGWTVLNSLLPLRMQLRARST